MAAVRKYQLLPNKLGCIVQGIDLKRPVDRSTQDQIVRDVTENRLLVFKGQGIVPAERQMEIGRWFGAIESTFYNHPKSPHRDIFRVSNDRNEGCTNVGRTGWHIDGSFQERPFSHSIYHIIECPREGGTVFAPLSEVIEGINQEKMALWNRLYMASDRRSKVVHPHLYKHPLTHCPTLCFHLGMTDHYILDYGTSDVRILAALQLIPQQLIPDN